MVHEGIFATLPECTSKAGASVSATGFVEANINQWCAEAESYINVLCRYNFSDDYAGLNADVKKILTEACSNMVAIYGIQYDMSGFTSRIEAENMIKILWSRFQLCVKLLKDQKGVDYINKA